MNARMFTLVLLLMAVPSAALACRCAQLPFGEYFQQAEFVAMAKLTSATDEQNRRVLVFELMAAPYKGGTRAHVKGSVVRLATPLSTASCGIMPDIDAIYVVFAEPIDAESETLWVSSCNGTRVHISTQLEEAMGFIDVPARFVAGQLNAHFGLEVLGAVSANAPRADDPANETLIGLLDLKVLAHGGHASVRSTPSASAPVIREVHTYDDIESREFAYEQPGAVVYARVPGWFRVKTTDKTFGWVSDEEAGTWFPYSELPVQRLSYLTDEWSGLTWPGAGAGIPIRKVLATGDGPHEYPVEVLESIEIGGMPWFRVEVLATEPCSGDAPKPGYVGWVPAYGRNGKPNAWFYSRGC